MVSWRFDFRNRFLNDWEAPGNDIIHGKCTATRIPLFLIWSWNSVKNNGKTQNLYTVQMVWPSIRSFYMWTNIEIFINVYGYFSNFKKKTIWPHRNIRRRDTRYVINYKLNGGKIKLEVNVVILLSVSFDENLKNNGIITHGLPNIARIRFQLTMIVRRIFRRY